MIFADKLIDLRKKNGWSQEELANKLGVSRQSVSKWESAGAIPDLDKIIAISKLFNVTTDYLLDDNIESSTKGIETNEYTEKEVRTISLEEAREYLDVVKKTSTMIALAGVLCVLSPIVPIYLCNLATERGGYVISLALALGVGVSILVVFLALALFIFIYYGYKILDYKHIYRDPINLSYGVDGVLNKLRKESKAKYVAFMAEGIVLIILGACIPPIMMLIDNEGMLPIIGVTVMLVLAALGTFIVVTTFWRQRSYIHLLEEDDYTRTYKAKYGSASRVMGPLWAPYWLTVIYSYFMWSFISTDWKLTWIVWPIAIVFMMLLSNILGIFVKSDKDDFDK